MIHTWMRLFAPALIVALAVPACGPAPEGDSPVTGDAESLTAKGVWRWTALTGPDTLEVDDPGLYTLEFLPGGRYEVRADCNRGSGTYSVDGSRLNLEPGSMTMAGCGSNSLDLRFVELLAKTVRFGMDDDALLLELDDGAGSMRFEMTPP